MGRWSRMDLIRTVGVAFVLATVGLTAQEKRAADGDRTLADVDRIIALDLNKVGLPGTMSVARIFVRPGIKTPEHKHDKRTGVMIMLQGIMLEHRGMQVHVRYPGEVYEIPEGTVHWSENAGTEPIMYIETSIQRTTP